MKSKSSSSSDLFDQAVRDVGVVAYAIGIVVILGGLIGVWVIASG